MSKKAVNSLKIQPITDRIWVKPIGKKTVLDSGIHLPEAYVTGAKGMGKATGEGVVYAVGPDVTELRRGQHIFFSDFTGMEIEVEEQYFLVMKEDEVMAVCG